MLYSFCGSVTVPLHKKAAPMYALTQVWQRISPGSICRLVSVPVVPKSSCIRATCSGARMLNS